MGKRVRKQLPLDKQLRRHLRNRKAHNAGQCYEHVRPCISRSAWFSWLAGTSSLSTKKLEQILEHLGLHVVILDDDAFTATGRRL